MRGRKDHYLPRGYLKGFIHPNRQSLQKPLWHYDVESKQWAECSPAEVGFEVGFYDPLSPSTELEIADETFAKLEREYPPLIKELAANQFANWRHHFSFLLHFMQMMRARSPLFFQHNKADLESRNPHVIEEIDPTDNRKMRVKPVSLPPAFIKNRSLMQMREEILKGPDWLKDFDWALRWTDNPDDPCITSEQPFAMAGTARTMVEAFEHEATWLHFPLCWQAALFGSRTPITDPPTDRFVPDTLHDLRNTYFTHAENYVISPLLLDDAGAPNSESRS